MNRFKNYFRVSKPGELVQLENRLKEVRNLNKFFSRERNNQKQFKRFDSFKRVSKN